MSKFGATPTHNAGLNQGGPRTSFSHNGERRLEIRPAGITDRFVDLAGHIVTIQLAKDGDADAAGEVVRARHRAHLAGFIEHTKCPLLSGARMASPSLIAAFSHLPEKLRIPCDANPKTRVAVTGGRVEARESCPHVEWHRANRITDAAESNANRNATRVIEDRKRADEDELRTIQLTTAKEALAAQRAKAAEPKVGK